MAYRNELDAARRRIETLEATVAELEAERGHTDRKARPGRSTRWAWIALAATFVALFVGLASATSAPSHVPAPPPPALAEPATPSDPAPPPVDPLAVPPFGYFRSQRWTARVARSGTSNISRASECTIALEPLSNGSAAEVSVTCGSTELHRTPISASTEYPPCWYDGRDVFCAPILPDLGRLCWISTAVRSATCGREIDLYIEREPRPGA